MLDYGGALEGWAKVHGILRRRLYGDSETVVKRAKEG